MKTMIFILLLFSTFISANSDFDSKYTSIDIKKCKTLTSDKMGGSFSCEKYSDINVELSEGDIRQSLTLVRKGIRYPLNLSSSVSPAFSFLGKTIEWRFNKKSPKKPFAMINRFTTETGERSEIATSYLVVSKITDKQICVVGKVKPQKNQNILARNMADKAHDLACLLDIKYNKEIEDKKLPFIKSKSLDKIMDINMKSFKYIQNMGPIEQSLRLMELPTHSKWSLRLQLYPIFSELRVLNGYRVVFDRFNLMAKSKKTISADRHELVFHIVQNNSAVFSKEESSFKTLSANYKSLKDDGDWGESKSVILAKSPWESEINTLASLVRALAKEAGWVQKNGLIEEWNPQEIPEGMNATTPWLEVMIDNHLGIEGSYTAQWHDFVSDDSIAKTLYYIYVDDDETDHALVNSAVLCGRGQDVDKIKQICK